MSAQGTVSKELVNAWIAGYDAMLRVELAPGELFDPSHVIGQIETDAREPADVMERLTLLADQRIAALINHGVQASGWIEWLRPDSSLVYMTPLKDPA